MAANQLAVANAALARLGEPDITSIAAGENTSGKVNNLYEDTILSLLAMHKWRWARKRVALTVDGAFTPVTEWTNGFIMPTAQTEMVGQPIKVYRSTAVGSRPHTNYEIQARHILTNDTVCVIEYTARKTESLWPGFFVKLAVEKLAATLALPITENRSKEEHHNRLAGGSPSESERGGYFKSAVQADLLGSPTEALVDGHDPAAEARFGGG